MSIKPSYLNMHSTILHCRIVYSAQCTLHKAHITISSRAVSGVWGGREMGSIVGGMGEGHTKLEYTPLYTIVNWNTLHALYARVDGMLCTVL